MIVKSKAPFRIGLAGGGTDVSPYSDMFGGAVLNAAISLYAHVTIETNLNNAISIINKNTEIQECFALNKFLVIDGNFDLIKGVINRIQKDNGYFTKGFTISYSMDVPTGSGLGTSSTLIVAALGAFYKLLNKEIEPHYIAQYAYDIERNDLGFAGGRQDQYAAAFGGINFIEFGINGKNSVTPIILTEEKLNQLQQNLLLYYTDSTRLSSTIIIEQQTNVVNNNQQSIEAMHNLKQQALQMKEALVIGDIDAIGPILDFGFANKRNMASGISNNRIEEMYTAAKQAGATGGKISGAGGGGFMVFYCPGESKTKVEQALQSFGGNIRDYAFTKVGIELTSF